MEMHGIKGLPALFLHNLQKTFKKLVWKHMKFYTMTHYISSSTTRKIFTMNWQNTSLKYEKEFKQTYSSTLYSFEKMERILRSTQKVYWAYALSWWKTNPTILPLKHMPKLRTFSTNDMKLGAQTKETWK